MVMMMEEEKKRRLGHSCRRTRENTTCRPVSPLQRKNMHLASSPDSKLEAIQATLHMRYALQVLRAQSRCRWAGPAAVQALERLRSQLKGAPLFARQRAWTAVRGRCPLSGWVEDLVSAA